MSPRPGGETDKFGNRYEGRWTVRHLMYVLAGSAEAITVEDIGDLAEGSEFTVYYPNHIEVHQVKRQNRNANSWSVRSLQEKEIWSNARLHIAAGRQFRFVSTVPSRSVWELADRARRSEDLKTFIDEWLTNELKVPFDELSTPSIYGSPENAWKILKGFDIAWPDERDIVEMNSTLAELLIEGAAGKLAAVGLGDLINDNLGVQLDKVTIEAKLADYGLRRAQILSDRSLTKQLGDLTSGWSASIERELLQPSIERPEAAHLFESMEDNTPLRLLTGAAGGGKTGTLQQFYLRLKESQIPVLAFRLDRLDSFGSTTELGERLGIPVSPVTALAAIAGSQQCILIVDQLDAVSLASGRVPENFDSVASLVREAAAFPKMRVILACRKFDVENDYRIRELTADKNCLRFEIGELPETQVIEAVEQMGLNSTSLSQHQKKLLSSPLHLVLLESIADDDDALSFDTINHLFDAFWKRKIIACKQRRESVRFNEVVTSIAKAISARQRLSVPESVLDQSDLSIDADILVSEHLLVHDGRQLAFFHETFFDYVFARDWIARDQSLIDFLGSGEQELFRRSQVRQVLNHLRELEPERFIEEVEELLISMEVRYHIKDVILALLKALRDPKPSEWEMILRVLNREPSFRDNIWQSLQTSYWFECLDSEGVIEDWLSGGDEVKQARVLNVMVGAAKSNPSRLAQILGQHVANPSYLEWLRWVTRFVDVHESRPLFELLIAAIRSGQYEGLENELWPSIHGLGEHQPAWAIELLAAYLIDRPESMAIDESGKVKTLLSRDYEALNLVSSGAAGSPKLFCDLILPYMLRVMELTSREANNGHPIYDLHFSYRIPKTNPHELEEALLIGAKIAICSVVRDNPLAARSMLETLESDPHDASQWLLYQGLIAAGETFAEWSATLLLQGRHRFLSGYSSNSVWTARQLIQTIGTSLSDELFQQLESAILSLRFSWERRRPGWYMFNLLSALDETRLSEVGRRKLGELRRATNMEHPPEPSGITGGFIGSPIPQRAVTYMTDDDWLRAFAKHNQDRTDWEKFTGGARELSNLLQEQVKKDPYRFSRLALRLTIEMNPVYGDGILIGLGNAEPLEDPGVLFDAVRHISSLQQAPNDRWLGWALQKHIKTVPLDLVEIIADRALTSKEPTVEEAETRDSDQESLYSFGMNSARGGAAEILGDLLVHDSDGTRTALVIPILNQLAEDPVIAVRVFSAHVIHASMRFAREDALEAFARLIETDDQLLATRHVSRMIAYLGYADSEAVVPIIQRMLASADPEVREVGGQLAALAAMQWGKIDLLESVVGDIDIPSRKGLAAACATGLRYASNVVLTRSTLFNLFYDENDDVRKAAATVAGALRNERLAPYREILFQLIDSPAFIHSLPQILFTFEHAPDRIDDLVLRASSRFIEVSGFESGNIHFGAAGNVHHIGELLVRAYAQAHSKVARSDILNLLDNLLMIGVRDIADIIGRAER